MKAIGISVSLILISIFFLLTWGSTPSPAYNLSYSFTSEDIPEKFTPPLGLPPIPWPKDNPYSKRKAEVGMLLYFDKRLSSDSTIACSSCHSIPRAFADRRPVSQGIKGQWGSRHAPTVINSAYEKTLFWDGRASSLEEQAKGPIANPKEMSLVADPHLAHQQCEERIRKIPEYCQLFQEIYGNSNCSIEEIAKSIATFERTIVSGNSPFDRYMKGDKSAMTAEQIHGYQVFKKVGCANCHAGPLFTDGRFLNIGVGMDKSEPDLGRYDVTHDEKDWGAFKVPTLREAEHTYPYMHDGSLQTLEDVIDYYDKGGIPNKNLHPLMVPLHLTNEDKKALVSFLKALNGEGWQHFTPPKIFPQ
jgi:cytochrome c peroxidase